MVKQASVFQPGWVATAEGERPPLNEESVPTHVQGWRAAQYCGRPELAAKARGLMAIESASGLVKQVDLLTASVRRARANGFDGMMARHPSQVPVIDDIFARSL